MGGGGEGAPGVPCTRPYTCLDVICLDARRFTFEVADTDVDATAAGRASPVGNGAPSAGVGGSDDENSFTIDGEATSHDTTERGSFGNRNRSASPPEKKKFVGAVFFDDPLDVYYLNEEWEAAKRQSKELEKSRLPGERPELKLRWMQSEIHWRVSEDSFFVVAHVDSPTDRHTSETSGRGRTTSKSSVDEAVDELSAAGGGEVTSPGSASEGADSAQTQALRSSRSFRRRRNQIPLGASHR